MQKILWIVFDENQILMLREYSQEGWTTNLKDTTFGILWEFKGKVNSRDYGNALASKGSRIVPQSRKAKQWSQRWRDK